MPFDLERAANAKSNKAQMQTSIYSIGKLNKEKSREISSNKTNFYAHYILENFIGKS